MFVISVVLNGTVFLVTVNDSEYRLQGHPSMQQAVLGDIRLDEYGFKFHECTRSARVQTCT